MLPDDIFAIYVRPIGIGTFFTAGLVGIILSFGTIVKSIRESFGQVTQMGSETKIEEHNRDLRITLVLGLLIITVLALACFFYFNLLSFNLLATLVVMFVAFALIIVFTPAAIMATIMMGNAPVSGMTIVTLIFSCLVLAAFGFTGKEGMLVAALFGTFMCTTLAFASSFITDLKIGYWLGATPAKQEGLKLISSIISVVVVIFAMIIINEQYGFVKSAIHPNPMPAPQANAMAGVIQTFLGGGDAPWYFYGFGAFIALFMRFVFGISPLAIALGLYIPIEYNIPLLVGAVIAHLVSRKTEYEQDDVKAKERSNRGLMLCTGFVAASSIIGILSATLKYFGFEISILNFSEYDWSNWLSLVVLVSTAGFLYIYSKRE